MKNVTISSDRVGGIVPLFAGYEACEPGHSFGPFVRDCYLIHLVRDGKGIFWDKHGEWHVGKGQMFIIRPDEVTTYTADTDTPWSYIWLGFRGEGAKIFDTTPSVMDVPSDIDERILEQLETDTIGAEIYISFVYELIHRIRSGGESDAHPADRIKRYVRYNYMLPLTVEGIARQFGFDRSYVYRLFKERYGIGIKEYIIDRRMKAAMSFLKKGHSVADCARLVGYSDQFAFSKAFKEYYGASPSAMRKE
ncbi:MAG: AraC family transcriptional regulator [Clostridia bacterium]|nr:AraC family transcriptional regulator [Clostridia bacterium]